MKKISIEKIMEIIEECKKPNPYPKNIFSEPTKKEYQKMQKAFKKAKLSPDMFFGSWGREVWNNCLVELKNIMESEYG